MNTNHPHGEDTGTTSQEFTGSEPAPVTEKKKDGAFKKVVIVAAAVAVLGVVGFYFLQAMKPKPAPAPRPTATAPSVKTPPAIPSVAPTATVAPPAQDPLAGLVSPDATAPTAAGIDPLAVGPGVTPPAAGASVTPAGVVPPTLEGTMPSTGAPADPLAALTAPAGPTAGPAVVLQPAGEQPSALGSAPAAGTQPPSALGSDLAAQVGVAVTQAIRPMETRFNARFDALERRVGAVETRNPTSLGPEVASAPAAMSTVRPAAPRSTAQRPAKRKPVARPVVPKAPVNRIEVLGDTSAALAQGAAVPSGRSGADNATESVSDQKSECRLGAVLQGRAWVKRADGSFETYGVGDTLPDGKVVSGISPDKGIQVGGRPWSCR